MNIDNIFDEIQAMSSANNISDAAHSYINILTALEELYKAKVIDLCYGGEQEAYENRMEN